MLLVTFAVRVEAQTNVSSLWQIYVHLSYEYVGERVVNRNASRSPATFPSVCITNNSVEVPESLILYSMIIISDDGQTVFSTMVESTEIDLPYTLMGDYEIIFYKDCNAFRGEFSI